MKQQCWTFNQSDMVLYWANKVCCGHKNGCRSPLQSSFPENDGAEFAISKPCNPATLSDSNYWLSSLHWCRQIIIFFPDVTNISKPNLSAKLEVVAFASTLSLFYFFKRTRLFTLDSIKPLEMPVEPFKSFQLINTQILCCSAVTFLTLSVLFFFSRH